MTNAERIRNMTDEELAEFISNMFGLGKHTTIYDFNLKWLKKESEEE